MYWIAVHDEILGSKLRGFRKTIGCADAEAVGILVCFWLWARKNTDITGVLENTDKDDIACAIKPVLSDDMNPYTVTDAMIEHNFIDDEDGVLVIHDWSEWQAYWYSHVEKKERDKRRKRELRASQPRPEVPKLPVPEQLPAPAPDAQPKPPEEPEPEPQKPKEKKIAYASNVRMTKAEYEKLVDAHGSDFTDKLVYELDVYKGSTGKRYKSDYMTILNWVVDKCRQKYPGLEKRKSPGERVAGDGNPFGRYLD